jgi:hypothetical protein
LKKQAVSFYRPTGQLAPDPAALSYASVELGALEYQARRGEIIWLYADETLLWRFALPVPAGGTAVPSATVSPCTP